MPVTLSAAGPPGAVQAAGEQEGRLAEASVSLSRHHAEWQGRPRRTRTLPPIWVVGGSSAFAGFGGQDAVFGAVGCWRPW